MTDVYSIGEMLIDFIPGSEPASYIRKAGGAPANVAVALAKNGLSVSMCCKVGDDDFGRFLMDTLKEYNVKAACPELCKEAVTTMAFVTLEEDGERKFTFARKPGADTLLCEDDVKESDIADTVMVHAGSCSLSAHPVAEATVKAMRLAHEKGKLVSFDLNYRNVMWDDDQEACAQSVLNVLQYVDFLKISEEEVDMVGGEENLFDLMEKYGIAVVVLTLGSAGARAYFRGEKIEVAGRKAKAVDATGAGDAFWGGFLSNLRIQEISSVSDLSAEKIQKAIEYGNVSGFICVQTKGAIASLPTRAQIEACL